MLKNLSSEEQLFAQLADMIEKEKNNDAFALPCVAEITASGFGVATIGKVMKRLAEKKLIVKAGKRYSLPGRLNLSNGWMAVSPLLAEPIVFNQEAAAKQYAQGKRGVNIEPCKIVK